MPSLLHLPRLIVLVAFGLEVTRGSIMEAGFGYTASTDVTEILNLALDIKAMREAKDDFDLKKKLYAEGQQPSLSLQKLSLEADIRFMGTPYLALYQAGFAQLGLEEEGDAEGNFDGNPVKYYADTVVNDLFLLDVTHIEAEAALVMNVAMAFWGSLWKTLEVCRDFPQLDNAAQLMKTHLDQAAAFWIGAEQVKGDGSTGYFFYNAAQFVGSKFNQAQTDSEVEVNQSVIASLLIIENEMKRGSCSDGGTETMGYQIIREVVKLLTGNLNQVLVQMLIFRIMTVKTGENTDFVELYALSLLPQIASCNPDVYYDLTDLTIDTNVTPDTQMDVIRSLQSVYSCLLISCSDVGAYEGSRVPACDDEPADLPQVVGTDMPVDTRSFLTIDRDIRQIRLMMQYGFIKAAQDFYEQGWNSQISLSQIANNDFDMTAGETFEIVAKYYNDPVGVTLDSIISQMFTGVSPFDTQGNSQLAGYVDGLLKGPLMYLATTSSLESAVQTCSTGDEDSVTWYWALSISFFVGSTEGSDPDGALWGPGESLWGLADEYCEFFGDCVPHDAEVNENIIANLQIGQDIIAAGNDEQKCIQLKNIYEQNLRPLLLVAMVQGILYHYIQWSQNPYGADAGYVYSFSRILLPLLSQGDGAKYPELKQATISPVAPQDSDVSAMFGFFREALMTYPTDCEMFGAIQVNGVILQICPDSNPLSAPPVPAPFAAPTPTPMMYPDPEILAPTRTPAAVPKIVVPDHPDGLAWGRYNFVDQVVANNEAKFALDIKAMWSAGSPADASVAYQSGTNVPRPLFGAATVSSVAALSTEAGRLMQNDILHNFYLYALYDDEDFDINLQGDIDAWPYGDEVVVLALDPTHGDSTKLAAEAATVMNVYMMIIHQMYEASRDCQNKVSGPNNAPIYVDSAVGLWIGEEQGEGLFNTGYSMYGIAQEVHKLYGNNESEAPANTALMNFFNEAQTIAKQCNHDGSETGFIELRAVTDLIIHEMSKPLIQLLLYYLSVEDTNFSELFALAFLPQVITCNIDEFGNLRDELFQGKIFDEGHDKKLNMLKNLAGGLSCLRYSCGDLGDTSKSSQSLQTIVQELCEDLDDLFSPGYLASYQVGGNDPSSNDRIQEISELSRLDLDLLQIGILMKANALQNAQEIFEYGRNSRGLNFFESFEYVSLKMVANDPIREKAGGIYNAYQSAYGDAFGDTLVTEVLENQRYRGASRTQKAEAVVRTIQTTVLYANIVGKLYQALEVCFEETPEGYSSLLIDEAAALFVGSSEGSTSGPASTGAMLMALGKEICNSFDTCVTQGDSVANEFILFAFSDMKQWFDSSDCDSASEVLNESLLPMLPVSLLQATIKFAYDASTSKSTDAAVMSADVISQSIIPIISTVNATSGEILKMQLEFETNSNFPVPGGPDVVVEAISYSLRNLGIDCNSIGTYQKGGVSLCKPREEVPPLPDTTTVLGDDKFHTTTYVQDRADIAKDVLEIRSSLSVDLARDIYTEGQNSNIYDGSGTRIAVRSLKHFSTGASTVMQANPLYQTAVYALQDANGSHLGAPATQYADTIVLESFSKDVKIAADAAVALNLWMEATNELFQMLSNCQNMKINDADGVHSIDEAAAYWIGDANIDDQVEHGHLLFALAESMAQEFDTVGDNGQALSNTNFLQLLQAAKLELAYPQACSDDITTLRRVRHVVNKAVSQMMVPLVQALINHIIKNDRDRVRVFAYAVVPQLAACSPSAFEFLKEKLITGTYSATEIDSIVLRLQGMYGCLGINCDDVGYHRDSDLDIDCLEAEDFSDIQPLAGFRTRTDASQYARLDLDIQELDVLMAMGAYEAAQALYRFGRHAQPGLDDGRVSLSLQSVATNTGRTSVPEFVAYEQYFGNEPDYADRMITNMFNALDSPNMTSLQRRHVAVATNQYLVIFMGALQAMYDAVAECKKSSGSTGGSEFWDRAAAYIIGHLEGTDKTGTNEGRFIWALAKEQCQTWGTCSTDVKGNALVNERILTLLYAGRGALTSGSCAGGEEAINELKPVLLTPIVQGALSAVIGIHESSGSMKEEEHARAYVFSNALLPLIDGRNRPAANMIKNNMSFDKAPLKDGLTAVVDSFTSSISAIGVDCEDVGQSSTVDSCSGKVSNDESTSNAILIVMIVILSVTLLGLGLLIYRKWLKRTKRKSAPVFIPNDKGELSHSEVIGNGSSRFHSQDILPSDADAAADDDFEHTELPETV